MTLTGEVVVVEAFAVVNTDVLIENVVMAALVVVLAVVTTATELGITDTVVKRGIDDIRLVSTLAIFVVV